MPREHTDLARLAGDDQHLGVALERRAFRRDDRDREERMVGHSRSYAAAGSSSGSGSGSGSCSGAESSPASCFARSTTCSIVPTM